MSNGCQRYGVDPPAPWSTLWVAGLCTLLLAGCTKPGPDGIGAWGYVGLSFGVVAVGAFALGRLHAQARQSLERARPMPAAETPALTGAASDTTALCAAFDAQPQPCAVATESAAGWRVDYCNRAASTQWPALRTGGDLSALPLDGELQPLNSAALTVRPFIHNAAGQRGLMLTAPAPADLQRDARHRAEQEAARESERESASFSFTVSHDLRAPIRVVEGFTRIVKEDYGRQLDRVGNDHLERVLGAAARMNQMIDALLTLARLSEQPLARQPVNLSQLASFVIDDLRKGGVEREVDVEIEAGLVVQGDPTLLRLVLENLLGNAWKYSQRNPRAVISLHSQPHDGSRAFVVRDNGAGFDMRSAERLFGIFQRLHSVSEFPGHGVGLASVRRIVRRHGGAVWAEGEPGRGATFYFTLAP